MDHEQQKSVMGDDEKVIKLELDSEPLWQWDTGRRLILTGHPAGTIVDFIQLGFQTQSAIAQEQDGTVFVQIPNEMLYFDSDLRVYIRRTQEDYTQTVFGESFPVRSRPKPEDYISSESEILTWKKLAKRISILEEFDPVQYTAQDLTPEQRDQARENINAQRKGDYLTTESDPTVPAWAKQPEKPKYTAREVGADPIGIAAEMVNAHNHRTDAHPDIRTLIQQLTQRLDIIANSDDVSLDQLHEIVTYIKDNRDLIEQVTTGKVSIADIVNNLTTNAAGKPLSAAMGVELKRLIEAIKMPTKLSEMTEDTQHRTVTDSEKQKWNNKLDKSGYQPDKYLGTDADGNLTVKDAPGGGGEKPGIPSKFCDYMLDAEVAKIEITAEKYPDISDMRNIFVRILQPESPISNNITLLLNNTTLGSVKGNRSTLFNIKTNNSFFYSEHAASASTAACESAATDLQFSRTAGVSMKYPLQNYARPVGKINKLSITISGGLLPVGTRIAIWGC